MVGGLEGESVGREWREGEARPMFGECGRGRELNKGLISRSSAYLTIYRFPYLGSLIIPVACDGLQGRLFLLSSVFVGVICTRVSTRATPGED